MRETSVETYHWIKNNGVLSKRRWEAYDGLYQHGPCTGTELFYFMKKSRNPSHSNITTRLGELRDMGCVKEVGCRQCSITGMRVIVWDVTMEKPRKYGREYGETSKEKIKRLLAALTEIMETTTDLFSRTIASDAINETKKQDLL